MKRVLFISILTTLCVVACGEKSNLGLKSRPQDAAPKADTAAKNPGELVLLKDADNRVLAANAKATRNVLLGDDTTKLTVLCTTDLAKTMGEKARIKILGGGQVIVRQDPEIAIPEKAEGVDGQEDFNEPSEIVNFACKAPTTVTTGLEENENVASMVLTQGEPTFVKAKVDNATDELENLQIVCGNSEELTRNATQVLMGESGEYPIKMVIGLNTKILVELKKSEKNKNYALISCQAAPAEVAPKVEENAVIQEKTASR